MPSPSESDSGGGRPDWLTVPAIAGIAGGGVALIAIVAAIVIVCRKKMVKPQGKTDLGFWDSDVPPSGTEPYSATTRYTS
jgi:hypothetical protein